MTAETRCTRSTSTPQHSAPLFGPVSPDAVFIALDRRAQNLPSERGIYVRPMSANDLAEEASNEMRKVEALLQIIISASQTIGLDSLGGEEMDWALIAIADIAERAIGLNEAGLRTALHQQGGA